LPSLDETAVVAPPDDEAAPASDDVLAAVKAEGGRRRARRHRRNAVVGALGLVALAVPALALLPDDGDDQLTVAADAESSTTEARETTTTTPSSTVTTAKTVVADTTLVTPSTAASRPATTAVPRTTVPPLDCHNSTDPACGAFRWEPAPGTNQALAASFVDPPTEAVVGQEATFVVDWSDPDADQITDAFSTEGTSVGAPCSVGQRYGPWTPPPAQPGSGTRTFRHTFTSAGVYPVNVDLFTGNVCVHPYASERHIELLITVVEAPTG
jgi:hypothetical protein